MTEDYALQQRIAELAAVPLVRFARQQLVHASQASLLGMLLSPLPPAGVIASLLA